MQQPNQNQKSNGARPGLHKGLFSPVGDRTHRQPLELSAREAVLNAAELRVLFTEIASFGKRVEASQKLHPESDPEVVFSLARLFVELSEGKLFGAQIWYEHQGVLRTDTLICHAGGTTCVRSESHH
jgi:hypothetical protein